MNFRSIAYIAWFFLCSFSASSALSAISAEGRFQVVVYNVENLFDVDGVAMFRDYSQYGGKEEERYSSKKLLTKLSSIVGVLRTLNDGKGPDVVLFQELEADVSPETSIENYDEFLEEHSEMNVADMLQSQWKSEYAGLPASAWLVKALSDGGMSGYGVVTVPSRGVDSGIAHTNAVFSRFPIRETLVHPLVQARDILEVVLDVDGAELIVFDNHWKSGASNPKREPIRVENARILKARVDALINEDPLADILVGGDLNSHYNHKILYPTIETGINDILGSQGNELELQSNREISLYNLWFELPSNERFSEVWRGRRGTLMHLLLTKGLYDNNGIRYVDGSFRKLLVPGWNVDGIGRPLKWSGWGEMGNGASDHFPIYAEFERVSGKKGEFVDLISPSSGDDALDYELPHEISIEAVPLLSDGAFLSKLSTEELDRFIGNVYKVNVEITGKSPLKLKLDEKEWPAYVPNKSLFREVSKLSQGELASLVVTLGIWRGAPQLLVEKMMID